MNTETQNKIKIESRNIYQKQAADRIFQNRIAETQKKYTALTPYYKRKDLTAAEIVEIGNYQDVHPWNLQKQDWSIPIPENWKNKTHCYVNNSCCRFEKF